MNSSEDDAKQLGTLYDLFISKKQIFSQLTKNYVQKKRQQEQEEEKKLD